MKKIFLIAGISTLVSFQAMADTHTILSREQIEKQNREYLAKSGINIPNSTDISIVSASKYINIKNPAHNQNDVYMAKRMQEYLAMNQEQQKNGYIKDDEPRAKELLDLKNVSAYQQKKYKDVFSPTSTHIRASSNELKLAYTFIGVPEEEMDINLGVAPYGAYKQVKNGDDGNGWDGAVQFFEKKGIGSCAFTEHDRRLARSGVELIKELVTYDVDNKPTIILVKGTQKTGFLYKIKWYDQTFSRELECANLEFNAQIRTDVLELANRIENHQHP